MGFTFSLISREALGTFSITANTKVGDLHEITIHKPDIESVSTVVLRDREADIRRTVFSKQTMKGIRNVSNEQTDEA